MIYDGNVIDPSEALDAAIFMGIASNAKRLPVGKVVERMSPRAREALARLRPEHIENVRRDLIFDDTQTEERKKLSKMLQHFDRQLLKSSAL